MDAEASEGHQGESRKLKRRIWNLRGQGEEAYSAVFKSGSGSHETLDEIIYRQHNDMRIWLKTETDIFKNRSRTRKLAI